VAIHFAAVMESVRHFTEHPGSRPISSGMLWVVAATRMVNERIDSFIFKKNLCVFNYGLKLRIHKIFNDDLGITGFLVVWRLFLTKSFDHKET